MSTFTGFKDYPDNSTPLSAEFLNAMLDLMYPIGKVEVFFDNLDHSDYLGFTWERTCVGRMPVGYNANDSDFNLIGKTGGSKTHTQTVDELAHHTHQLWVEDGSSTNAYGLPQTAMNWNKQLNNWANAQFGVNRSNVTQATPMNIMNPYQVFAFWKRVEAS